MARLSASVAFFVKISSSGVSAPSRSAHRSRARLTARDEAIERRWPERPVLPPAFAKKSAIASSTTGRLGPRGGCVVEVDLALHQITHDPMLGEIQLV